MTLRTILRLAKCCELDLLDDAIALWWRYKVHPTRESAQLMRIVVRNGCLRFPDMNLNEPGKEEVGHHLRSLLRTANLQYFTGLLLFPIQREAMGESFPFSFFVALEGKKREDERLFIEQWLLRNPLKFKRTRLKLSRIDEYNARRSWQSFTRASRKSA